MYTSIYINIVEAQVQRSSEVGGKVFVKLSASLDSGAYSAPQSDRPTAALPRL